MPPAPGDGGGPAGAYGHGSTSVAGDRDRREAVVSRVIVRYVISAGILTVTVVRLIPEPCPDGSRVGAAAQFVVVAEDSLFRASNVLIRGRGPASLFQLCFEEMVAALGELLDEA